MKKGTCKDDRLLHDSRRRGQCLLEGGEGLVWAVDVGLVHLVCQQHDALLLAEFHHVHLVLVGQDLARGVAWVNHHQRAHILAIRPRLFTSTHPSEFDEANTFLTLAAL